MAANTQSTLPLRIFIRKHVINKAVMNYAGEGYFVLQLSKLKELNLSRAAIIVKDLNLARTFIANFWILFLIVTAVMFGSSNTLQHMIQARIWPRGENSLCLFHSFLPRRLRFNRAMEPHIAGNASFRMVSVFDYLFHHEKITCRRGFSLRQCRPNPAWPKR